MTLLFNIWLTVVICLLFIYMYMFLFFIWGIDTEYFGLLKRTRLTLSVYVITAAVGYYWWLGIGKYWLG